MRNSTLLRNLITILFLLLLSVAPVFAADFQKGLDAALRGDFATAQQEWRPLAEQGNAVAQYNLGQMYRNGDGVTEDDSQAVYWYKKAAEQGHAKAQYNLGVMYSYGEGVAEDDTQAVYWYKKAAEQGDAAAQYNLGNMYDFGKGVTEDDTQAVYWYRKAAEQGVAIGQWSLATMYQYGEGVAEDDTQAVYWYRKAAEQGNTHAQFSLGLMYDFGYGVAEDDTQAVYWYRKAAEQGYAKAQYNLGLKYGKGEGVAEDYILAYKWANLAAAQGDKDAIEFKNDLRKLMTQAQIAEAQRLSREWSPEQSKAESGKAVTTPGRKQNPPDYTGSSFVVSRNGHVLTNRHVVVGCATLRVGGKQARVVSEDANNDLALLRLDNTVSSVASFREGRGARIGDKVAVAGYPLRGLLSDGLSMTFGNISALAGIGNDSRLYQISAPVNPGNSGGPLLDSAGNIVGIVTSKLNALRTAKLTGDIPQGVNFAIKSSVIRLFLDLNNVDYETARSSSPKSSTQISAEAQKYTMLVQCWK
jgi:hypothetical protein